MDAAAVETVTITESEEIDLGISFNHLYMDEKRKLLLLTTNESDCPGSILLILASPILESRYDLFTVHGGAITAICQSYDGSMIFTGKHH